VDTLWWAAIGALTGAVLGLVQRDRRRVAWLALAGLLGFGLLWLVQYLLVFIPQIDGLVPGASSQIEHDSVVRAICGLVWGAIGGSLAGACLGLAQAWQPGTRPIAPEPAP
jgi:uncharacterized membrane protein